MLRRPAPPCPAIKRIVLRLVDISEINTQVHFQVYFGEAATNEAALCMAQ